MSAEQPTKKLLFFGAVFLTLASWMSSCSSTEETQDAALNDGGGDVEDTGEAGGDTGEGGEGENNATSNEFSQGNAQGQGAENFGFENQGGEAVNNATEGEEGSNEELNLGNNNPGAGQAGNAAANVADAPINNVALTNSETPTNAVAEEAPASNITNVNTSGGSLNAALTNTAPVTEAPALEPAATDAASTGGTIAGPVPTSGGLVKYVRSEISATNQPGGGQTMKKLEQGDHPLVWDEGEFARMQNGTYVPASSLSTDGIGRSRNDEDWRR